ncbi:MAG: hypothetical protein K1X79_08965 [Oligoflexia bacterium]|nr:hypothetical protein [Oligoflexia bacterium]
MKVSDGSRLKELQQALASPKADPIGASLKRQILNSYAPTTSDTPTISEIEKHVDDYRKGKGNLSESTAHRISAREDVAYQNLSSLDPVALTKFGAYSTAFTYSQRSRYVNAVGDFSDSLGQIKKAFGIKV